MNLSSFRTYIFVYIISLGSICLGQVEYQKYSKEELREDLDYFSGMVTSIHPLLLDKNVKNSWQREYSIVKNNLKEMTQNEFYLSLAFMMSSLNDSHSGVDLPFDQRITYVEAGGLAFPFLVDIEDYRVYVKLYLGSDSTLFAGGEEIVKINGIPAADMVKYMQNLYGSRSEQMRQKSVAAQFRFLTWIMYGLENDYDVVYKDVNGNTKNFHAPGISSDEFRMNIKRLPEAENTPFSFRIDKERDLAVLKIGSFGQLEAFCAFADSAFSAFSNNNIQNLVIDVRGNAGGRSIVVDSLMNYLTGREYAQYRKIEIRASEALKERYKEKYPDQYSWLNQYAVDELVVPDINPTLPKDKSLRFSGNMFLLTDKHTFSAAATFAGLFKELELGTIVGEETGGTIEYYGDYWFMKTPNTGITFYVAPKKFTQYGNENPKQGVIPDHKVKNIGDDILHVVYEMIELQ